MADGSQSQELECRVFPGNLTECGCGCNRRGFWCGKVSCLNKHFGLEADAVQQFQSMPNEDTSELQENPTPTVRDDETL